MYITTGAAPDVRCPAFLGRQIADGRSHLLSFGDVTLAPWTAQRLIFYFFIFMIYLDSNATSQVHPDVVEAMLPYLTDFYYNPSSGYTAGKAVKKAIVEARTQLAELIDATPDEITFTGCGTEANNMALFSLAKDASARIQGVKKIITGEIEHSAVLRVCEHLAKEQDFEVVKIGVLPDGRYRLDELEHELNSESVAFVSLMWANNETGVIQPIAEAVELAHAQGVPFHCDAIQAVGKMPVDVKSVPVDMLSISGHKFHAPKGVGALYIRSEISFHPMLLGGGQEGGLRSGTENVASLIGLGKAAEIMNQRLLVNAHASVGALRDKLQLQLLSELDGVQVNGSQEHRSSNTAHLAFDGCEAAGLLILLDNYGLACSAGSACMTGKQQPSHVQKAMGYSDDRANSSLRISLSMFTTEEEIRESVRLIKKAVTKMRSVQGSSGVGPVVVYTS